MAVFVSRNESSDRLLAVAAAARSSAGLLAQEPEFLAWVERAERFAAAGTRHRALADLFRSIVLFQAGDTAGAWTLRQRALELARQLSDDEAFLLIAGYIIAWPWAPQHEEERLELAREVAKKYFDAADKSGFPLGELAKIFLAMGERARAEELWSEIKERAKLTQDATTLMGALSIEAEVALFDGQLDEVIAMGDRIASRGEELGLTYIGRLNRLNTIATPLLFLGRAEEILAEGGEFAQNVERMGAWDQIQALNLAYAGRVEEAVKLSRG